jgi:glycosyltransferase involved in cell wall biosynthesis
MTDIVLHRGSEVPRDPPICVVVLSLDSDPRTREAVLSLLQQDVRAEIVVVNTGAGSLRTCLAQELDQLVLVECAKRHFAGGARNLGIGHSTAPIVAFLACDCLATPGWLQARLGAHKAGDMTVSSALAPAPGRDGRIGRITWAAFAMTHIGRTPQVTPDLASCYGLSYSRDLFVRFGLFDAELRVGEDTAFNRIVAAEHAIRWHPAVVTLHRYPYHLKMINETRRRHRRDLYAALDPAGEYQAEGYDYLADETGAVFKKILRRRSYSPPHSEDGGLGMPGRFPGISPT